MLHAITTPNAGRSIVHHFQEGAAVWGQQITPSIAHIIQLKKELAIAYSRVAPGIIFEVVSGIVLVPHVIDPSHVRFHTDAAAFRRAGGVRATEMSAVLTCDVGGNCLLRLWGCIAQEQLNPVSSESSSSDITIPVVFTVTFWEIACLPASTMRDADADERIRLLEAKVALSMCSQ